MADRPSPKTIDRVTDAYLPQDVRPLEEPFQFNGWRVARYPSHITPGWIYLCADRLKVDGKPEILSEDVKTDAEARGWVRNLPLPVAKRGAA